MYLTLKQQIEAKEKKIAQAKAQLMKLQTQEAKSKRNTETRRKTVIGGLILKELEEDEKLRRYIARLINRKARESDKVLLDDIRQYAEMKPQA